MSDDTTTVLIVDDHPLVRQGLLAVLGSADGVKVVGEASEGNDAVSLVTRLEPDVVLMDLQMPGMNGIDATRAIVAARPATAVLVVTMFEDDDMVFSAVAAGAKGYLLKGADGADIVAAIRSAGAGQAVFGAALAERLRSWFSAPPRPAAEAFPQLTDRERSILDGVAAGLTNSQIGEREFLAAKTVANNVSNILAKLQLAERGQAIIVGREAGLGRADDASGHRGQ